MNSVKSDHVNWQRCVAVLVYVAGSVLVTTADSRSPKSTHRGTSSGDDVAGGSDPPLGTFLCVLSAAMYALYTAGIRCVAFSRWFPYDPVGVVNAVP